MTEISFYHLTRSTLEDVLPELLEKTRAKGWRAVVMTSSPERAEALNQHLWTYRPDSFLPHGSSKDGAAENQPVWLTHQDERPNEAAILFLTEGAQTARPSEYERICEIFSGEDPEALAAARQRWKNWQSEGHAMNYWQQGERGWEKKQ